MILSYIYLPVVLMFENQTANAGQSLASYISVSSSYSSPPWLGAVIFFHPPFFAFPPHHCPFTPMEPGYGVDLFEDDYLFLLPAADLRMDPALRPRPVSSLTSVTLHNSATRLNDGIFTIHRFSVATPTRQRKSECVFCGLGRSGEVLIIINGTI
jgi:hypothetical protein